MNRWDGKEPHRGSRPLVDVASWSSGRPLDQVPARQAVPHDEPMLVDPPLGVHGADGPDGLLVRRPRAPLAGVLPAAPDARRQVAEVLVGCAEPIPASAAASVSLGDEPTRTDGRQGGAGAAERHT